MYFCGILFYPHLYFTIFYYDDICYYILCEIVKIKLRIKTVFPSYFVEFQITVLHQTNKNIGYQALSKYSAD